MELSHYKDPVWTAVLAIAIAQHLCERARIRGNSREVARLQKSMDEISQALNQYLDSNKE